MQVYNKKRLTNWFILQRKHLDLDNTKHDHTPGLPTVIKGLKLTEVTLVATKQSKLTGIPHVAKHAPRLHNCCTP
jgi:hypothetical protein